MLVLRLPCKVNAGKPAPRLRVHEHVRRVLTLIPDRVQVRHPLGILQGGRLAYILTNLYRFKLYELACNLQVLRILLHLYLWLRLGHQP